MASQGYAHITTFEEFTRRLVRRFDQKENDYLWELNSLRQGEIVDEFVTEFQRLAIMIHHILEDRLKFLFIEGLVEPLRGMVKVSYPNTWNLS